jgi:hypothetical protein
MAYKDRPEQTSNNQLGPVKHPEYAGELIKPMFDKERRTITLFRPVGPLTPDGTEFMPWRNSAAEGDIGIGEFNDWFYKEEVFTGGTAKLTTFIAASLDEFGNVQDQTIQPSVAHEFTRLVRRAFRGTVDEKTYLEGSKGRGAPVGAPKTFGFIQGMLYQRDEDDYGDQPLCPVTMLLPVSARYALFEALEEPNPDATADSDYLSDRFACGNVLDARTGKMFLFSSDAKAKSAQSKMHKKSGFASYVCEVHPQPFGDLARTDDGKIAMANIFTPWNRVLRYPTEKEMVTMLYNAYKDCNKILLAGLGHIHDALPASVHGTTILPGSGANAGRSVVQSLTRPAAATVSRTVEPESDDATGEEVQEEEAPKSPTVRQSVVAPVIKKAEAPKVAKADDTFGAPTGPSKEMLAAAAAAGISPEVFASMPPSVQAAFTSMQRASV